MKHRFVVEMIVEVEAFDESDAFDVIQDVFGTGDFCGVDVVECEFTQGAE